MFWYMENSRTGNCTIFEHNDPDQTPREHAEVIARAWGGRARAVRPATQEDLDHFKMMGGTTL